MLSAVKGRDRNDRCAEARLPDGHSIGKWGQGHHKFSPDQWPGRFRRRSGPGGSPCPPCNTGPGKNAPSLPSWPQNSRTPLLEGYRGQKTACGGIWFQTRPGTEGPFPPHRPDSLSPVRYIPLGEIQDVHAENARPDRLRSRQGERIQIPMLR